MNLLSLFQSENMTGNDARGAFIPQSVGFARVRSLAGDAVTSAGVSPSGTPGARRKALRDALASLPVVRFDGVAMFCHGTRRGLPSFGVTSARELAADLSPHLHPTVRVVLFACSTGGAPGKDRHAGDGEDSFADALAEHLFALGHRGWVDSHPSPGHTTTHPWVRRFELSDERETNGGAWLVVPGSPEWVRWRDSLRVDHGLRFGFPFMKRNELYERLYAPGAGTRVHA